MFAGIVAGRGKVVAVSETADDAVGSGRRLTVDVRVLRRRLVPGASVAVSGVCLTVVRAARGRAEFDVIGETLRCTTLDELGPGDDVNLEGSLRLGDEIGGHQVMGHVDGVGRVVAVERRADETWMTVRAPEEVHDTLVAKGWVAVHGCSLTVAALGPGRTFSVALIPTTLALTTLGAAGVGTRLNLEGDAIGKHVARWLAGRAIRRSGARAVRRG